MTQSRNQTHSASARPAGPRRPPRRRRRKGCLPGILFCLGCLLLAGTASYRLAGLGTAGAGQSDFVREGPGQLPAGSETLQTAPSSQLPAETPADGDWCLVLVNRDHPLPDDYTLETVTLDNGQKVDARIYPALQQMFDDMRAQGIYPVVASGFRTAEEQQQTMEEKIREYESQGYSGQEARTMAEDWVALPGTSEHQLGLAVDINADGVHSAGYEVYDWLQEHAWEYGFVKRYPEDKTDITGISNEPWHYRYVGKTAAKAMTEQGLCLEEYLETN